MGCKRVIFALMATILILGGAATAKAQAVGTTVLSLEGADWTVAADPGNVGRDQGWWKAPVADAKPVRVPGIFQEALPGYHGVAWYGREFDAPQNPYTGGRCLIRFHAVDYLADVWVNDTAVGGHEGGETPFTLDITDALKADGANRLTVRVLNPKAEAIDGIVLAETPHRNKVPAGIGVGGSYNSGGITEPVEIFWTPAVRIDDVYVRPDWQTGKVMVQATLTNSGTANADARVELVITPAFANEPIASLTLEHEVSAGTAPLTCEMTVVGHRLWQLYDPYLYRLNTRVIAGDNKDLSENSTRFGFRELRVDKGYFHLNGKRIFLKSSHTGNHCPFGAILPPASAPDLLRKDLLYMKSCGFNTIRFIAGIAHPYQLDLCDEIGLMAYEENLASWLLGESPKMGERFDANLREMLLRDRNHPSVVIFGLVNEMGNGALARHAQASLGLLRSLDDSRLVLQQSGRWDGQYNVGSVCNPGGTQWEYMWGVENADYQGTAKNGPWGGYFEGSGDAHVYPSTPHTPAIEAGIRNLGKDSKPVFLSEYGIGSLMNAVRELRYYEQHGANPEWDDYKFFKQTEEKLSADWMRLGFDGVYAYPEDMLRASQEMHCRQRTLGFNLIRSNPKICGYNLTGLLDHGYTGEGLWTFWREFKPGIMDTLQDGWSPLRWCLFAAPMNAHAGHPIKLEAVLANEDVLAPGSHPAWLRVLGPNGVAWEKKLDVIIPAPAEGEESPLAVPVFAEDVTLPGPAGQYTFHATLEHGGAPTGGRLTFYQSEASQRVLPTTIATVGIEPRVLDWLTSRGITTAENSRVILVGEIRPEQRENLMRRVNEGGTALFLNPGAFKEGDDETAFLPLKNKGRLTHFSDWLYHKECVAKRHALFTGLQAPGIMDWGYYGPIISNLFFEGQDTPDDTAAAAFAVCHSSRPDGYAAGVMLGTYKVGAGRIVLNTFNILDNVDKHPAADQMLLNLIEYAGK